MAVLIGASANSTGGADNVGWGQAIIQQYTAATSGVVDTVGVFIASISGTVTGFWGGIFSDSSNAPGTLLGQGQNTDSPPASGVFVGASGLSVSVVAGTTYWLAFVPTGSGAGNIHFNDGTSATRDGFSNSTTMVDLSSTTTWTVISSGSLALQGTGTPSGGADLNVNLIN